MNNTERRRLNHSAVRTRTQVINPYFIVLQSKLASDGLHEPLELGEGLLDLQPELPLGQVVVGLVLGGGNTCMASALVADI